MKSVRVAVAALLASVLLAGCAIGQPRRFTDRADKYCAKTSTQLGSPDRTATGTTALEIALTRYTAIELLVSEVTTDTGFPDGTHGATLRRAWIDPARRSLVAGRADLDGLRDAIRAHEPATQIATLYARALSAGASNVDTATLRTDGLPRCATLFTSTDAGS